jgi:hypothetical protein
VRFIKWLGHTYSRTADLRFALLCFSSLLAVCFYGMHTITAEKICRGSVDGLVSGDCLRPGVFRAESRSSGASGTSWITSQGIRTAEQIYQATRTHGTRSSTGHGRRISTPSSNEVIMADTPQAILANTKNLRTRESMLLGSALEGGWSSPYPVGDGGTSFGPYQMHEGGLLTSLGLTSQQAENANTATKAILPTYTNAVNQISEQKWQSDPQGAAEQAAYIAERPAQDYYIARGTATVNKAWSNTTAVLSGQKSQAGMPPQDATLTSAGGGGILGSIGSIAGGLATGNIPQTLSGLFNFSGIGGLVKSDAERIGLVVFGSLLVLAGIIIFAIPAAKSAAKTAAEARIGAKGLGLGNAASEADRARRNSIAERSLAIGEKNAQTKATREARLDRNKAASTL